MGMSLVSLKSRKNVPRRLLQPSKIKILLTLCFVRIRPATSVDSTAQMKEGRRAELTLLLSARNHRRREQPENSNWTDGCFALEQIWWRSRKPREAVTSRDGRGKGEAAGEEIASKVDVSKGRGHGTWPGTVVHSIKRQPQIHHEHSQKETGTKESVSSQNSSLLSATTPLPPFPTFRFVFNSTIMTSGTKEDVVQKKNEPEAQNSKAEKAKPGASWRANEEHVLPENRLSLVCLPTKCHYSEPLTSVVGHYCLDALYIPRSP